MHSKSWNIIFGFLFATVLGGHLQTTTESQTSIDDGILNKENIQYGLEEGSGSVAESSPPVAEAYSQHYRSFLKRKKRAVLFPSGVKVCPEETFDQALVNHVKFFKLRVCQETVWEVFKIFWDRLPDQAEYKHWMRLCEDGTMPVFDIGEKFSQSDDHHKLVMQKLTVSKHATSSACTDWNCGSDVTSVTQTAETTTFRDAAANVPQSYEIAIESYSPTSFLKQEEIEELDNEIFRVTEKPKKVDKMVEFSILILNEQYSPELSDKSTDAYTEFAGKFIADIENVFNALPGYKGTIVQKISPSLLDDRLSMEVRYAVIFDGDADAINQATLDLMNLHSNKIEDTSLHDIEDNPTAVYTVTSFRNYIMDGLKKQMLTGENTLDYDPDSLQLINVKNVPSHLTNEWTVATVKPAFPVPSTADVNNALQAEWLPTEFSTLRSTYVIEETSETLMSETQVALEAESPFITADVNMSTSSEHSLVTPTDAAIFQQSLPFSSTQTTVYKVTGSIAHSEVQEESGDYMPVYTHTIGTTNQTESEYSSLPNDDHIFITTSPPLTVTIPSAVEHYSDIVTSAIAAEEPALSEPTLSSSSDYPERIDGNTDELIPQGTSESLSGTAEILVEDNLLPTKLITENIPHADGSGSGLGGLTIGDKSVTWLWTKTTVDPLSSSKGQVIDIDLIKETQHFDDITEDHITNESPDEYIRLSPTEISPSQDSGDITAEEIMHQSALPETFTTPLPEPLNTAFSEQTPQSSVTKGHEIAEKDSDLDNSLDILPSESQIVQTAEPSQTTSAIDYHIHLEDSSISNEIESLQHYVPVQTITKVPTTNENAYEVINSPLTSASDGKNDGNLYFTSMAPSIPHDELSNTIPSIDIKKIHPGIDSESTAEDNIPNVIPEINKGETISDEQFDLHPSGTSEGPTSLLIQSDGVTQELQETSLDLDYMSTIYFHPDMSPEERSMIAKNVDSTDFSGVILSTHESSMNASSHRRALVVFFSLRVTNMIFSEDLFNKNSPEYKALEQRFLELLVPYLQSNLTGFQNLEILNFRNGSIIVNSRMKFAKPVPRNATNTVYIILEDFCNTAYQTMNLAIDKYSLDVESGDVADPCKFQACNEYSECLINKWSGEGECVCNPGYVSVDGMPCQSICDLEIDFCQNDGKCDIIPGQGAICRCRVGENWWYRGEHCEEYVSEPLVVGIAIAAVAGFLLVASAIIFFLARTLRGQSTKGDSEESAGRQSDSLSSIENAVKYNPMYESDTTGYSHYYKRYPQLPSTSSTSPETSADFSSEEIRHIYENSELTKEEIQDRIRIIELYAKDQQFADFVRQHQMSVDTVRKPNPTS
ncbi:interphotoreceptor matrix proteoglycan 2 isoform X2 [Hyperolius riggenbachi]|uniref:interphotoreceptor matrix proteoglycan 2 isoform X2 n=1 Tax=Hyperolius riggenbachi TaxID=752182 RepID=UPI0035A2F452